MSDSQSVGRVVYRRVGTLRPTPAAWRRELRAAVDELRRSSVPLARMPQGVGVPCDGGPLQGWRAAADRLRALGARVEAVLVGPREFSRDGVSLVLGIGRASVVVARGAGADSLWRAFVAALRSDPKLRASVGGLDDVGFRGARGV